MNFLVVVPLAPSPEQHARLMALQAAFAAVCNAIAPTTQAQRCWNRVALHHMVYKPMREAFPDMGSQMVCNAIYAVCRSARAVYQHPNSPFNVQHWPADKSLPLLRFADDCPVYFDRHTLSIKAGRLSMYTLDGRMKFDVGVSVEQVEAFREQNVKETLLVRDAQGQFSLKFVLVRETQSPLLPDTADAVTLPSYLAVEA